MDIPGETARLISALLVACVVLFAWTYVARKSRNRELPVKNKYGPLALVLFGGFFMLLEPIRYELHDGNIIDIGIQSDADL